MELPFTPYFFKKLSIFQQIAEYENDIEKKPIWLCEKVVLNWAQSQGHQYIGSPISTEHVAKPLSDEIHPERMIWNTEAAGIAAAPQHILNALITRGFATRNGNRQDVFITQEGFIAGRIIKETNNLDKENKEYKKYKRTIKYWFMLTTVAGLVLLFQLLNSVLDFFSKLDLNGFFLYSPTCSNNIQLPKRIALFIIKIIALGFY